MDPLIGLGAGVIGVALLVMWRRKKDRQRREKEKDLYEEDEYYEDWL